jgi:hypothetical protein
LLSIISLNAWSFICQPEDNDGYNGYSSSTLHEDYFIYHARQNNYTNVRIVQTEPGSFKQNFWCLYQSDADELNHINSCDNSSDDKPICRSLNIGGFVDGFTNTTPYADPLIDGGCSEQDICLNIPQVLSVSTGEIEVDGINSVGTFLVVSNGWVDFNFMGDSRNETGGYSNLPYFYKQEVDAQGEPLPDRYDLLSTKLGVRVTNADLLNRLTTPTQYFSNNWKLDIGDSQTINQPNGTPEEFILSVSDSRSPGATIGAISPLSSSTEQAAEIKVYATAIGGYSTQSGIYNTTIQLSVTAHEQ